MSLSSSKQQSSSTVISGANLPGQLSGILGQIKDSKASLATSPSGQFIAILWPEAVTYSIVDTINMREVDRGYGLDIAWVGASNHYIVKTPPALSSAGSGEAGGKAPANRRGSITGLFFKAEKAVKKVINTEVICKKIIVTNSDTDSSYSAVEHSLQLNDEKIKADGVFDLFSGMLLSMNTIVVAAAYASAAVENNSATPVTPKDSNSTTGRLDAKFYHSYSSASSISERVVSGFYLVLPSTHIKDENETESMKLVRVGPVLPPMLSTSWDYVHNLVAALDHHGLLHILRLSQVRTNNQVSLELSSMANIPLYISSYSVLRETTLASQYCWNNGVLVVKEHRSDSAIREKLVLYSFWPTRDRYQGEQLQQQQRSSDRDYYIVQKIGLEYQSLSPVANHNSSQVNSMVKYDWKTYFNWKYGEIISLHDGQMIFYCRDGNVKALRQKNDELMYLFQLLHLYYQSKHHFTNSDSLKEIYEETKKEIELLVQSRGHLLSGVSQSDKSKAVELLATSDFAEYTKYLS